MAQNLVANGISNVVIDPRACSDVVGEVTFYISKNQHTSSLLKQRAGYENGLSESVPVPSVTLDRHWRGVAESGRRLDRSRGAPQQGCGSCRSSLCEHGVHHVRRSTRMTWRTLVAARWSLAATRWLVSDFALMAQRAFTV